MRDEMKNADTATYAIVLDGLIYVEDALCEFDVEIKEYEAEPYSWGQSRGTEVEISATLTAVKLGGWAAPREIAIKIFGEEAIGRAENVAQDRRAEEQL